MSAVVTDDALEDVRMHEGAIEESTVESVWIHQRAVVVEVKRQVQ